MGSTRTPREELADMHSRGYQTAFTTITAGMLCKYSENGTAPQMLITYADGFWNVRVWDSERKQISSTNKNLMYAIEDIFRERLKEN